MFRRLLLIVLLLSAAMNFLPPALASEDDELLPKDPNNVYGQFDNGMKYIIRKNANPPGKVALYLHVKTGAINETDQQNGLAHFTEHMAFNGSKNYPPGKLVPLLNHLGMTFGADTNAHTSLLETVYKLTMPNTKPETLDTALTIFSDYAAGLDLSNTEIESERRVILEEARSRKSAAERMRKKLMKELYADTRLGTHDIIGDEVQIKTFPKSEFDDYWNTWYQPQDMTLIVAGDIDPVQIVAMAKEKLGVIHPHGSSRPAQKAGLKPFDAPKVVIVTDPEQVAAEVGLTAMKPARPVVTTYSQFRQETIDNVAEWIVNRRYDEMIKKGGAPFRDASVDTGDFLHEVLDINISAEGEPQDWNKMLDAVILEVTRAIDHGFTQHELELARSDMLAGAERALEIESSRDSTAIVSGLSSAVGRQRPILSAQQRLDLMKRILETISVDELHKAFADNFTPRNYAYVLMMPESKDGFKLTNKEEVLAAANAAWARKAEAPAEIKLAGSILAGEPEAGKIVSQETDKDLQITTATFANGAVMHHKFNDYKKDSVLVRITMPGGKLEETDGNKGISEAAGLILARPATKRFTSTQIRDLMTGKTVGVYGSIGLDSLSLSIDGSTKDLPAGMRLAYALLTEGTLEQSALDEWKKRTLQELEQAKTNPMRKLSEAMSQTFYGGDVRLMPMTPEVVNRIERSPAEAWYQRIAENAAIEVAVVGDIKLQDAIDLVAKYVGSLPKRSNNFAALDSLRKLDRGDGPFTKTVHFQSVTPKAMVLAGFVSCQELDPERRPLTLAEHIISDRMIERIREKDQLVYSIGCNNRPGRSIPGTGMFMSAAPTDPKNAEKLGEVVIEMLKDFADKGPTDDELDTAKKQIANALESQMKEPGFWINQIGEMSYRGRPLSDLKQLPEIYQTFTRQQVQDVFKKYLKAETIIRIEVIPEARTADSTKPATQPAGAAN